MTRNRLRLVALAAAGAFPFVVVACKKDPPPAPVVETTPAAVESVAPPLVLEPLIEDAGSDVVEASVVKKPSGPGVNANQARAKLCCSALRTQAKSLGASPEAAQIQAFAATCDGLAAQLGPSAGPQAPELAPLRAMLQGKTIPNVCQGL